MKTPDTCPDCNVELEPTDGGKLFCPECETLYQPLKNQQSWDEFYAQNPDFDMDHDYSMNF